MTERKKRILIVDDEESLARLLKMDLERTGAYEVLGEQRGAQAVAAAREFRPDVIVLDVIMPDLSGLDVAAAIKADALVHHTPIVFLTATVSIEDTGPRSGTLAGYPCLAKPVTTEALIACLEQHLGAARPEGSAERTA